MRRLAAKRKRRSDRSATPRASTSTEPPLVRRSWPDAKSLLAKPFHHVYTDQVMSPEFYSYPFFIDARGWFASGAVRRCIER